MLFQALFFCVLAIAARAKPDDGVMAPVLRPRSLSEEAHNEIMRNFWTNERMKAAIPIDMNLARFPHIKPSSSNNMTSGPISSVPGTMPLNNTRKSRAISSKGHQVATTGRVFWQAGSFLYSCSAAIVGSKTGDLIVTAGHCVYDTDSQTFFNNNNWVFVPAYSNNRRPYGTWSARSFLTFQGWVQSGDFNYDVAFVALSTLNRRHIQSVVGSQGIGFNYARSAYIYAFGYPANLDNARFLKSCVGYAQRYLDPQDPYVGQGLRCNMGHGSSGGPRLQKVVERTGVGYVTSVNSFTVSSLSNVLFGPYFGTSVKNLYNRATLM